MPDDMFACVSGNFGLANREMNECLKLLYPKARNCLPLPLFSTLSGTRIAATDIGHARAGQAEAGLGAVLSQANGSGFGPLWIHVEKTLTVLAGLLFR